MKKKIVFGLSIFAMMFFLGGIYIITTMESTTYELHSLAALHNVVVLRKDLLIGIEENQSSIKLRGTRYASGQNPSGMVSTVALVNKCLGCHHPLPVRQTIANLRDQIETYQASTLGILTTSPNHPATAHQVSKTLQLGDDLIRTVKEIIERTSANLKVKEGRILDRVKNRKITLFLMVTIGPFFAVGYAFILIHGLTRPVNSLLTATRQLKSGDLDHRIEGLSGEFGEVADSFNEMAASLKKQMQEMQRTEQLRVCGEMAAGLAHEIRNPLAGMKVSIEVLLSELEVDERDRAVLTKVIEQIRHIELLIKNLLNFARPVAAQPTMVSVNKLLEKTIYFIERHPSFSAREAHKRILRELDDKIPETYADPQQLQQVFLNLFLNAADATPEGGTITVKTWHDAKADALVIELHDTGKGIPKDLTEKIFQPFFTTKGKGTGLGLAVSKRIVEEHGGEIGAMNSPSGGATFRVSLPVKEVKGAAA